MKKFSFGASLKDQSVEDYSEKDSGYFLILIGMGLLLFLTIAIVGKYVTPIRIDGKKPTIEGFNAGMTSFTVLVTMLIMIIGYTMRKKHMNGFAYGRIIEREESNELITEISLMIKEKQSLSENTEYLKRMKKKLEDDVIRVRELKSLKQKLKNNHTSR